MCLYHTYHWDCCPGTAKPAPQFMNSICALVTTPVIIGGVRKRCKIEFTILDGGDHGEACPECGQTSENGDSDGDDAAEEEQQ